MDIEISSSQSEKEHADSLIALLPLPPEVSRISTASGRDETGDNALFVHLHLVKDAVKHRDDIKKIAEFSEKVQVHLMSNGITHFPYVYVDEAA